MIPLSQLQAGLMAEVVRIESSRASRRARLTVYGIVPGSLVSLLQHHFACLIMVGETEIALDPAVAAEIIVRPI